MDRKWLVAALAAALVAGLPAAAAAAGAAPGAQAAQAAQPWQQDRKPLDWGGDPRPRAKAPAPPKAAPRPPAKPAPARPAPAPQTPAMAMLPGGSYAMGETNQPTTVQPFLLDVTEVTVEAYRACVQARRCAKVKGGGGPTHPVVNVSWRDAVAFCEWRGARLPTEEEWEWAARGAERGTTYPWGNELPVNQLCWDGIGNTRKALKLERTCPVGSYPGGDSPQGVKDLSGNVWEWTASADGGSRLNRGGGWANANPEYLSAILRFRSSPTLRGDYLGFRCAKSL